LKFAWFRALSPPGCCQFTHTSHRNVTPQHTVSHCTTWVYCSVVQCHADAAIQTAHSHVRVKDPKRDSHIGHSGKNREYQLTFGVKVTFTLDFLSFLGVDIQNAFSELRTCLRVYIVYPENVTTVCDSFRYRTFFPIFRIAFEMALYRKKINTRRRMSRDNVTVITVTWPQTLMFTCDCSF